MSAAENPSPVTQPLLRIGSYRLVEPLGSGGMSSVFRAVHVETGHEVAVKILPRTLARNPTILQRFLREAKSAEALEHPNIVAIYDRGMDSGRYYLVLEYVPGGDLHDRVRDRGALPVDEAVRIIQGVARGLEYAAQRGLVHRDIKPANILLSPEGEAKIADLGLAVQQDEEDERVTRDGTTVGTVDYMAPEQARDSRAAGIRSDIYSLGCTLYHLLAGVPPFAGGDLADKLRRHATTAPPDLRVVRPDVPPELAAIVARMLAKKPELRHASYGELLADLEALPLTGASGQVLDAIVVDDDEETGALDAIIVDDDDEEGEGGALDAIVLGDDDFLASDELATGSTTEAQTIPERPGPGARPPSRGGQPAGRRLGPGAGGGPPRPRPVAPPSPPEISLAELARLDDDRPPVLQPARPVPLPPSAPRRGPARMAALLDEDTVVGPIPGRRHYGDDDDLRTWILRGLLIGVAIVLLGFGVQQLLTLELFPPPQVAVPEVPAPQGAGEGKTQETPTAVPSSESAGITEILAEGPPLPALRG